MTFFRAFLFAYGGIKAAKVLHNKLLQAMMDAPIPFFDKTPVINIKMKKLKERVKFAQIKQL